jgi:hypothetical protein
MKIHLIDGTYELFRNYFGAPKRKSPDGREVGASVGLLRSLVMLLASPGTTHVACAFEGKMVGQEEKDDPAIVLSDMVKGNKLRNSVVSMAQGQNQIRRAAEESNEHA